MAGIPRWKRYEKYVKEHFDRFTVSINYEDKQLIQEIAQSHDLSMNKYICNQLYRTMRENDDSYRNTECPNATNGVYKFVLTVDKGERAKIKEYAKSKGESLNGFIKAIIHNAIVNELGINKTESIIAEREIEDASTKERAKRRKEYNRHAKEYNAKHFDELRFVTNTGLKNTLKEIAARKGISIRKLIYNNLCNTIDGSEILSIDDEYIRRCTSSGALSYNIKVPKGEKAKIKEYSESTGTNINRLINDVIKSTISKEKNKDFTIQDGVLIEYLGNSEHVIIPDGVETIGRYAFKQSRKTLKSVTIPDSVKRIGDCAFDTCVNLEAVSFGKNTEHIDIGAFYHCTNLKSITLPDKLNVIGNYAFADCNNLQRVNIPDNVTRIGDCAFERCSIIKVSLPANCYCNYTAFDRICNVTRRNSEPQQSRGLNI